MFHNIMVCRICTSGFTQWACVDCTMGICGLHNGYMWILHKGVWILNNG
jgi:hypothetical protein